VIDPHSDEPIKGPDLPELSEEEVEARIGVREGHGPRSPIARPNRTRRSRSRDGGVSWQGTVALLGGLVLAFFGLRYLQSGVPGASPTPGPGGSSVALASNAPGTSSSGESLAPGTTLGPPVDPSFDLNATPPPTVAPIVAVPTPTLAPGATPRPTTAGHTPSPTHTPGATTATLKVVVHVTNDNGGTASAGQWTETVKAAGASPGSFTGSESGTTVTLPANEAYVVTDTGPSGYQRTVTAGCTSTLGLAPGALQTCTVNRNDRPAQLTVFVHVTNNDGGTSVPSDWSVVVRNLADTSTLATLPGSASGATLNLDAGVDFAVQNPNGPSNYTQVGGGSGTCSSGGLALGQAVSCSFTEDDTGPPAVPTRGVVAWPLFLLMPVRRRRSRR